MPTINKVNARNAVDTNLQTTLATPAAGATGNHAGIDLGGSGSHREGMELHLDVPAFPALVDAKTVIFTLQDSADNSTFADVVPVQSFTITGEDTPGIVATDPAPRFAIASQTDRYVRVNVAVLAAAGDNTGVTTTATLLT